MNKEDIEFIICKIYWNWCLKWDHLFNKDENIQLVSFYDYRSAKRMIERLENEAWLMFHLCLFAVNVWVLYGVTSHPVTPLTFSSALLAILGLFFSLVSAIINLSDLYSEA